MKHRPKKRKLALACLTALASTAVLLVLHGFFVFEPTTPPWVVKLHPVERDMAQITQDGVLRVAINPDDVAYSVENGTPRGMAYELAARMARRLGLRLQLVTVANPVVGLRDVLRGKADLYATVDSGPLSQNDPVGWTTSLDTMAPVVVGPGAARIRGLADLRGRRLAVVRHTALEALAEQWQQRLDGHLTIERLPPLVRPRHVVDGLVRGAWPLALMDQDRARLEVAMVRGLAISPPLDVPLPVRWAVRPNAPVLARMTSKMLDEMRLVGVVAELERNYLEDPGRLQRVPERRQRLSPFDDLFRRAAAEHGLDWHLLAAVSQHESRHNPDGVGPKGSMGLMQLMPQTARRFGAEDPFDPEQNVRAAARHLRFLYDLLDGPSEEDRLAFTLAAYNMGLGHLEDARALAVSRGYDPNRWTGHVAEVLPLMEDPEVAAGLQHGFARGRITRAYVSRITELFRKYTGNGQKVLTAKMGVPS